MVNQENADSVDVLHREMGERLSAGVMGMLDFLAGLRSSQPQFDQASTTAAMRQVIAEELRPLSQEIKDLCGAVDEIKSALHKLTVLNAAVLQPGNNDYAAAPGAPQSVKMEPVSERISRAHVIERMLTTTRRLQESGRDITQMTAASLAREAGVKPAQFTYAFKNRENFMRHYSMWLAQQQSA